MIGAAVLASPAFAMDSDDNGASSKGLPHQATTKLPECPLPKPFTPICHTAPTCHIPCHIPVMYTCHTSVIYHYGPEGLYRSYIPTRSASDTSFEGDTKESLLNRLQGLQEKQKVERELNDRLYRENIVATPITPIQIGAISYTKEFQGVRFTPALLDSDNRLSEINKRIKEIEKNLNKDTK